MPVIAPELLALLVCPACHAPVDPGPQADEHEWLRCRGCARVYPVQDGIPIMLIDRAQTAEPRPS